MQESLDEKLKRAQIAHSKAEAELFRVQTVYTKYRFWFTGVVVFLFTVALEQWDVFSEFFKGFVP